MRKADDVKRHETNGDIESHSQTGNYQRIVKYFPDGTEKIDVVQESGEQSWSNLKNHLPTQINSQFIDIYLSRVLRTVERDDNHQRMVIEEKLSVSQRQPVNLEVINFKI